MLCQAVEPLLPFRSLFVDKLSIGWNAAASLLSLAHVRGKPGPAPCMHSQEGSSPYLYLLGRSVQQCKIEIAPRTSNYPAKS